MRRAILETLGIAGLAALLAGLWALSHVRFVFRLG
jgi:hypothetical protein